MGSKKVAIVTGCSEGGIGNHLCQKLAKRDFIVYATSRSTSSTQNLVHPNIRRLALDVTSDSEVKSVVATVIEECGYVDVLVNNAGLLVASPIIDWKSDDIKDLYDTNVISVVRLCREVVPHMAKRKSGTIVNMGSIVAEFSTPWTGIYDSSKAAIHSLTEVLRMECKPFNIHVMLVVPGAVQSRLFDRQDDFTLPSTSIYGDFLHNIRQRLDAGKNKSTMPTDVFAEKLVAKVIQNHPPHYFSAGGLLTIFRLVGLLPRSVYLFIIWRMFSKSK
ncbi:NAD-binding protein [Mycena venus]|uniref:NAD-binding protein n=1 Tax=Mycena venus TaxID=2733690 RepID=A0A8H6WYF0_9AGAR|nr:NAD-binding protein [Mycena venus]